MATSNNKRDVRLGVEIETAGEENLKRLATEVRGLAKAGGDAAPFYEQLANSIERNVNVARELGVFKQASEAIEQTSAASARATENAQRLRQEFERQSEVTKDLQSTQTRIRSQLDATNRSVNEQTRILAQNKAALKASSDDTGELAKAVVNAASSLAKFKEEAANLGLDLKKANAETKTAEAGLRKLAEQSLRADETAQGLQTTLRGQAAAMEAARAAGEKLGADFSDIAVAQERLDAALRSSAVELERNAASTREKAEADRLLALEERGLADQMERATLAARSELAAIKDSEAFIRRYTASVEAAAAAEARRVAKIREQGEADRLAAIEARGLADARDRARVTAASELAAIKESEEFTRRYAQSLRDAAVAQQRAAADALDFVEALDREAVAAEKAGRAIAESAAQGERLAKADQYVRDLAAAFDAVDREAAQAAAQVQKLQGYFDKIGQQRNIIDGAFGTTGVRSIQAIEQEMFKLQRALITLKSEFSDGRISLQDFERATGSAQVRLAALKREAETVPGNKTIFTQLAEGADNLVNSYGRLTVVFATVGAALTPLIREFVALESTTRILTQVTGSAEAAGRQIEFLRSVAQRSGQAFGEVSTSYAKFAASALQAGLSVETVQRTFQSVALAAGNLGLNSDQAKRALEALGQIASKGTVSMEELRQQLGDALPGVLPLLAKELGLTNSELNKLVEAGELAADSAIPALAKALETLGPKSGVVEGLVAEFVRFKNVMFEAGTELLDGPLGRSAGFVLDKLAGGLKALAFFAVSANEGLKLIGLSALAMFDVFQGNIKTVDEFKAVMSLALDDSAKKVVDFKNRAQEAGDATSELGGAAAAAAPGVQAVSAATTAAGTAAAAAATPQAALAGAVASVGTAAAGAVAPQQQMAAATTQVGVAAFDTFKSVDQLKVAYTNAIDAAKSAADTAKLAAEARKTEVETLKEVAALTGNEVLIKRTAVEAANQLAVAVGQQAAAEQKQLDLARQFRVALEQRLVAEKPLSELQVKDLARRDDELAKQAQAVQKTIEQAEALERQALQARLSAEAMADNADNQAEFARRAEESATALERSRVALAEGTISLKDFRDVAARAAFDEGLLNDAIADGTRRLEANSRLQTADTNLRVAGLKVKLEEIRNAEAKAKADGDETRAAQLKIRVKEAELEITRLNNEAKVLEARATVEATQRILAEADAGRLQLTPEKRAEYEARLLNAQAKVKEAEAAVVSEARDEAEIERLKRLRLAIGEVTKQRERDAEVQSNAGKPAAGIVNQQQRNLPPGVTQEEVDNDPYGRNADQIAALKKQGGPVDNSFVFGLQDRYRRGEQFGADEVPAIQAALKAAEANARLTTGSSVQGLNGQRGATADVILLRQVLARASGQALGTGGGAGGAGSLGASTSGVPPVAPSPTAATTTGGRTVNINLAGLGATSIRVASDADAAKVEAVLRQIEQQMGRSGG